MDIRAQFKVQTADEIKAAMRRRYSLADDAPVGVQSIVSPEIKSVDGGDGYRTTARITTDTSDADREIVLPSGLNASRFEKSPTIFWNHNYDLPVAQSVKLTRGDRFIDSTAEFARRPADYVGEFFPDFIRAMVNQQIVRGVSIGFQIVESRQPSKLDVERYGETVKRIISKWLMLEWSFVGVGANPDALVTEAIAKGIFKQGPTKKIVYINDAPPKPTPRKHVYILEDNTPPTPAPEPLNVKRLVDTAFQKARGRIYEK